MRHEAVDQSLAQVFGNLAVAMQGQQTAPDTFESIVHAATQIVPGVRWAGISLIEGKKILSEVPTSPIVAELDALQHRVEDGPCVTALREHHTVHIDDMRTETRWSSFVREAQQRGVFSSLSFQLFVYSENLGALNLYSDQPGAFSKESLLIGEVLAQHAAVAMIGAAAEAQFKSALATRDIVGQAKGILMERMDLDAVQAFDLLIRVSQETNMKLVDVAGWLVDRRGSSVTKSLRRQRSKNLDGSRNA